MELIIGLIGSLAAKYPVVLTIFAAMGASRSIFKSLRALAGSVVAFTGTKKDDAMLEKGDALYLKFAWLIDMFFSIKLPGAK